jgi:hypothetical protein
VRTFLTKLLFFILIQAAIFAVLLKNYDVSSEANFFARIIDKHRYLRSVSAPRVILLGGSNVPFGFDSDLMERALGRPVINMGLAAGLGVEFMLADIEPELRPGDTLVLSLEYDHFARGAGRGGGFDASVLQQVLILRPGSVFALRPMHFRKMILDRGLLIFGEIARRSLPFAAHEKLAPERSPRAAFNERGDLVGHRHDPQRITPEAVEGIPLVVHQPDFPNKVLLHHLKQFVQRCGRRGISVGFTFPPKPAGTLQRDGARARIVADALRQVPGLILLDTPEDHGYPPTQFFDSANHLTAEGAATRTAKVTAELKQLFSQQGEIRP